jgi:uncharacterized protein (TIGR03067 family)
VAGQTHPASVNGAILMKGTFLRIVVIALLSTTACSRQRSPVAAPSPASDDLAQEDLVRLQGAWRIESSVWNGVPERDVALSTTLLFQGNKLTWLDKDGIPYQEDTITLMPDRTPRAIDNWSKGRGHAAPGIYSFEGNTFRWCSAGGNNKVRPTSFASPPGARQSLMLLRRHKT